ncbi:MAG: hypothetical protein R3B46_04595 [Phycisphaerales bacterium]
MCARARRGRGWDAYCWQRAENRETRFSGFAAESPDDRSRIDGYLFMHQGRSPHRGRQSLALSDLAFTTPESGRRLLAFLSDYAMIADDASFFGSPMHPILALMPLQKYQVEHFDYWMTRITDLPKALEARGYLPGGARINRSRSDRRDHPRERGRGASKSRAARRA